MSVNGTPTIFHLYITSTLHPVPTDTTQKVLPSLSCQQNIDANETQRRGGYYPPRHVLLTPDHPTLTFATQEPPLANHDTALPFPYWHSTLTSPSIQTSRTCPIWHVLGVWHITTCGRQDIVVFLISPVHPT